MATARVDRVDDWVAALERSAPEVVAAWRGIEAERLSSARREIRRRAGEGSAGRVLGELAVLSDALTALVDRLPSEAFALPGGEADWTVAEAVGHVAAARSGLVLAAGLAAAGRWPTDAPTVIPGVPGPATASREELIEKLVQSQRIVARMAGRIAGHEDAPCPLHHPLVGKLRCGEWLFFAGVHDVMHIEQLEAIAARTGAAPERSGRAPDHAP